MLTKRDQLLAKAAAKKEYKRRRMVKRCTEDPLHWLMHETKTEDPQDTENPYKPFPEREYFRALRQVWDNEPLVLVEKSRTMMLTWFFAGFCLHHAMTHPASRIVFWGPDEARALQPLEYAWTLWENQTDQLQAVWPLERPHDQQSYDNMELANGSSLKAIPGKSPDRIRSEHPTIVFFDEACVIDHFAEALAVAQAARPLKIVAISSAKPGDFREFTKDAVEIPWPYREIPENSKNLESRG